MAANCRAEMVVYKWILWFVYLFFPLKVSLNNESNDLRVCFSSLVFIVFLWWVPRVVTLKLTHSLSTKRAGWLPSDPV